MEKWVYSFWFFIMALVLYPTLSIGSPTTVYPNDFEEYFIRSGNATISERTSDYIDINLSKAVAGSKNGSVRFKEYLSFNSDFKMDAAVQVKRSGMTPGDGMSFMFYEGNPDLTLAKAGDGLGMIGIPNGIGMVIDLYKNPPNSWNFTNPLWDPDVPYIQMWSTNEAGVGKRESSHYYIGESLYTLGWVDVDIIYLSSSRTLAYNLKLNGESFSLIYRVPESFEYGSLMISAAVGSVAAEQNLKLIRFDYDPYRERGVKFVDRATGKVVKQSKVSGTVGDEYTIDPLAIATDTTDGAEDITKKYKLSSTEIIKGKFGNIDDDMESGEWKSTVIYVDAFPVWGDVPWEFDEVTGLLTFHLGGNLGEASTSPWNRSDKWKLNGSTIKKIEFKEPVIAPGNSNKLFSSTGAVSNQLVNTTEIEGLNLIDTSKIDWMDQMFEGIGVSELDVSKWNVSKVSSMKQTFKSMSNLTDINIKDWDVSNVTNMSGAFNLTDKLKLLDLSNWKTSKLQDMTNMFNSMSSLTTLNISSFDTYHVNGVNSMFSNNNNLKSITLGAKFNVKNKGDTGLPNIEIKDGYTGQWRLIPGKTLIGNSKQFMDSYDGSKPGTYVWDKDYPVWGDVPWEFDETTGILSFLSSGTLDGKNTSPWNRTDNYTIDPTKIKKIEFLESVTFPADSNYLFSTDLIHDNYLVNVTSITGLDKIDTSKVTAMYGMFSKMESITSLDLSSWDTSKVTNMNNTFYKMESLTSLNVSTWDTSKVENFMNIFFGVSSLESLDVSNWNTSSATNMMNVFYNASSLSSLDLSKWNTSKVTNMSNLFGYMSQLESLDISNWNTNNVTTVSNMFIGDRKLEKITLGKNFTTKKQNTGLPDIVAENGYTGNWRLEGSDSVGRSTEFMNNYDGSKPGTYVWETPPVWGDVPWEFDETTGTLTFIDGGALAESTESPWNRKDNYQVTVTDIKKIVFTKPVVAPENSSYLFSIYEQITDANNDYIQISNIHTFEGLELVHTSNVTNMRSMFQYTGTQGIDLSGIANWDTSKVTNMGQLFLGTKAEELILQWEGPEVIDTRLMFGFTDNLKKVEIPNFNPRNLINSDIMFTRCPNLESVDISSLNLINSYVLAMFSDQGKLSRLTIGPNFRDKKYVTMLNTVPNNEEFIGQWMHEETQTLVGDSYQFMTNYDGSLPGTYVWAPPIDVGVTVKYINKETNDAIYKNIETKELKEADKRTFSMAKSIKENLDELVSTNQLTLDYEGYQPITTDDYVVVDANGNETKPTDTPRKDFTIILYYTGSLYIKEAPNISFGEVTRTLLGKTSVKPVKAAATNDLVLVNTTNQDNWKLTASLPKGIYNQTDNTVKLQSNLIFKKPANTGNVTLNALPDEVATNNELTLDPLGKVDLDASFQLDVFSKNDVGDYTGSVLWSIDRVP